MLAVKWLVIGAFSVVYQIAFSQSIPNSGKWEVIADTKGLPFGGGAKKAVVCMKAEVLKSDPELAFAEASLATGRPDDASKGAAPRCSLSDLMRDGNTSTWKASCEGPRGQMPGTGRAVMSANVVELQQTFEAKTPIGNRTLSQTTSAKRLGDC
jgi:Protein of unknown function (DUF3617)